ncbi:MAG: cytochrome b N-terminal domain-containing protein [Cyanobacteria bacterium SZAS-4]|nr:cytochrome b N-terminal domain-containing protein [Cyanobacteria bacterium SZAS-4]
MKLLDNVINWLDDRTGLKAPIIDTLTHLVPPGAKWAYVFGSAVLTALLVQLVTGVALATVYVPSGGEAFDTILYITTQAPFGKLVRGMHYFGASAMIVFAVIHMAQVYLWGAYKYPREVNWLSGVALLFFTVAMGFTGQILRWDQNSVWTVAVGAEQALRAPFVGDLISKFLVSGKTVGGTTLSHFFALHVFIFPGLLLALLALHLYLVLKNGISEPPLPGKLVDPATYREKYHAMLHRIGKPFWPDAAWRDMVFSSIVVAGILACAVWLGPPAIEKPPDPSLVDAQPRPDWYLVWYFAILALLPHKAEDPIIILFPIFLAVTLLSVPFLSNKGERSFKRRPWAVAIVIFALGSITALTYEGFKEPWTPKFDAVPLTQEIVGSGSGPISSGAGTFADKGCLYCHTISGHGGKRGPDLTDVGERLTQEQLTLRIVNGGYNMPAYGGNITPKELQDLTTFLESRKTHKPIVFSITDVEKQRISAIAQDGIAEIKLGELAKSKARNDGVKSFAQKMVTEHTIAATEMQNAANEMKFALPDEMNDEQKKLFVELNSLDGRQFEDKYMQEILKAHAGAVSVIGDEARDGTGAFKTWAQNTLVTIKRHHHKAQTIIQSEQTQ